MKRGGVDMKCIKLKCRHCNEHDFRISYLKCNLDNEAFKRDANKKCIIPNHIKELERQIELLKKYGKFIKYKGGK